MKTLKQHVQDGIPLPLPLNTMKRLSRLIDNVNGVETGSEVMSCFFAAVNAFLNCLLGSWELEGKNSLLELSKQLLVYFTTAWIRTHNIRL